MSAGPALQPGAVYRIRRGPVTTTQLVRYAGASGDFNPIHFDQSFALAAGLPGVVAHGMLTMGFVAACLTETVHPQIFLRELSCRFLALVRVGDVIEVTATVGTVDPVHGAALELEAKVGDTVVLSGRAMALGGGERP